MAKILVAASLEPRAVVERILAGRELSCADTMEQAEQFLREQTFDLIICTIVFDESKMFDLLQLAKSMPEWQRIPFVAVRVRPHTLRSPITLREARLPVRRWERKHSWTSPTTRWIRSDKCGRRSSDSWRYRREGTPEPITLQ